MSKEELPSRLRDFSNGMHGLAHDAAYIIHELEEVKAERDEQLAKWKKLETDLTTEAFALRTKRDELRQTVDRLDDALRLASREKDEWEANYEALANTTPRIITADELREGQVVIEYFWDLSANYGRIVSLHADEGAGHATIRTEDGELEATAFGGPGGTIVLLSDAPPQEPEPKPARRGRVVKPEELRAGDVYDLWRPDGERRFHGIRRGSGELRSGLSESGCEIRLISRKPPEPEDHPIILVHRANMVYEEPVPAYRLSDNAWATLDREKVFYADSLRDWSPARVVPAGQEE